MSNKYDVLASFTDTEDKSAKDGANGYYAGGKYPRDGYEPTDARIRYLQSSGTKLKRPVISDKSSAPEKQDKAGVVDKPTTV